MSVEEIEEFRVRMEDLLDRFEIRDNDYPTQKEEKIKEINEEPFDFFCRKVYICVLL
jgi:hypothetical protein